MSGDGGDGGDSSGGPPPEVPPEIGDGNQTTSAEYPSIPNETGTRDAQVPEALESSNQQPVEGPKPGIVPIEQLEMHKGPREPADPSMHILTNEEARYAAASLAERTGYDVREPIEPRAAEHAIADGVGTTRDNSGYGDVKVPGSGTPDGASGIEVKVARVEKSLDKVTDANRFDVKYGDYPPSESTGWTENAAPEALAEKLYEEVRQRQEQALAEKGIAPGLVTVLVIPYKDGTAQFFQFNEADVWPPRTQLGWRFSKTGAALEGFDRDSGKTIISWNKDGGQLRVYIGKGLAIARSDIFSRMSPEAGLSVEERIARHFPTLRRPHQS